MRSTVLPFSLLLLSLSGSYAGQRSQRVRVDAGGRTDAADGDAADGSARGKTEEELEIEREIEEERTEAERRHNWNDANLDMARKCREPGANCEYQQTEKGFRMKMDPPTGGAESPYSAMKDSALHAEKLKREFKTRRSRKKRKKRAA